MLIAQFEADQPGKISFSLVLDRPDSTEQSAWVSRERTLVMSDEVAAGKGVRLEARLKIEIQGGSMLYQNGRVVVAGADRAMLRLTAATDYWGDDPADKCVAYQQQGELKDFKQLLADHDGEIKGLRAIGGFKVDIAWEEGQLRQVRVRSDQGKACRVKYGEQLVEFETDPGREYVLDGTLQLK